MTQVDYRHRELVQMLPRFYDDSPEVDGLLYADAVEIERVRTEALDLLTQLTATTATWGLSDWERVLELPPRPNSTAEIRRSRILAKLRGAAPATVANMLAIINTHTTSKDSRIIELPEPGTVLFEINANSPFDLEGLAKDIAVYIPAHLAYKFATASHTSVYTGALTSTGISINVYPYQTKLVTQQTQVSNGGATINSQITTIYPKGVV